MHSEFSEFSFGYSLIENILSTYGARALGPPLIPSQRQEGRKGYDAKLSLPACPVFLQFKLGDYMLRPQRAISVVVGRPHYRFHLLPNRKFHQHRLLLQLERNGHLVFYAAPSFHLLTELSQAYLNQEVVRESRFIRPSDIGVLSAARSHQIAFRQNQGNAYLFSSNPRAVPLFLGDPLFRRQIHRLCKRSLILEPEGVRELKLELLDIAREFLPERFSFEIDAALADTEPDRGLLFVCSTIYNVLPVFFLAENVNIGSA